MALTIASELVAQIVAEARSSPGVEICGLLIGERAVPCRNVADAPATRFEIDPAALIAAYRDGRRGGPAIVGCYHSHPNGSAVPSPRDAADAAANGWLWLIVGGDGTVKAWRAVKNGAVHGRFDPVALRVAG
ncbi:proteasome lid subunit RPN8/RPN11 [Sphingomonas jinjuensis]|uniref:Proteasome lid subunit RPN8/RPN11 n=1 Tax=Sphingomonas jinjuensis TaxID=535907 RepID=A0A840FAQ0_9SPHN|nr:M67 family metallopeptidase [Sphingomonas jinjuensis]MBB4152854.1 proteasome lid subunit RPN8/RPN11 [Sphingomonas jinjuensis]